MALTSSGLNNGGVTLNYRFQYDDSLQQSPSNPSGPEPARTNQLIAAAESDFNLMSGWFGNIALDVNSPISVNIIPPGLPGACAGTGACWGTSSRNLTVTLTLNNATVAIQRYLLASEMTEQFMRAQGAGWYGTGTEGSEGEGLSRFLAAQVLAANGLGLPPAGFQNSNTWLATSRADFVNNINLTDDGPDAATGCSLLFIYYMFAQLNYSIRYLFAAGAPTLGGVYRKLTGESADPFPGFKQIIDTAFPGTTVITTGDLDNPFPLGLSPMLRQVFSGGNGVIYSLMDNGDLLWNRHDGHDDGTFRWANSHSRKVGVGWNFDRVFSGGNGVIYALTETGDLLWFRHDGHDDGTFRWTDANPRKVGAGWNFRSVFAADDGVIYAITFTGDLLWFRHDGHNDGSFRWTDANPRKVGAGWNFKSVFSGGNGVLYAVTATGDLLWFQHAGQTDGSFRWTDSNPRKVGVGWNLRTIIADGTGIFYTINDAGDLLWFHHAGRDNGSFTWTDPNPRKVGVGWNFHSILSTRSTIPATSNGSATMAGRTAVSAGRTRMPAK